MNEADGDKDEVCVNSDSFHPVNKDSAEDEDASESNKSFLLPKKKPSTIHRRTTPKMPADRHSQT